MPYVLSHDGLQLHVRDLGEGMPLVFVHGNNLDAVTWDDLATSLLAEGFRCIAYDQRGFGRSDMTGRFSYDLLAADLDAVLGALDLREVVLVGYSMGCGAISRYAARYGSERIAGAVFIGTVTPCVVQGAQRDGIPVHELQQVIDATIADRPALFASLLDAFLEPGTSAEMRRHVLELSLRPPLASAIACARIGISEDADFSEDLTAFTKPLELIHGDRDSFAPFSLTAARTAELVAHARVNVYEGGNHGIVFSMKERLRDDVARFVRGMSLRDERLASAR